MYNKKAKQKYFNRIYKEAKTIKCACGCGIELKSKDKYSRDKRYINGHNGRIYENPKQHKREWNHRNREKRYIYKKEYMKKRKQSLIVRSGGQCIRCGFKFNGNNEACFDFHHRNPQAKKFALNQGCIQRYCWRKILSEYKKCDLLCANCHRTEHI